MERAGGQGRPTVGPLRQAVNQHCCIYEGGPGYYPCLMTKSLAILGSTGSIGTTTLELVARFGDRFSVTALAAGRRVELLAEQIERFKPCLVSVADPADAERLASRLGAGGPRVVHGPQGLVEVATAEGSDMVVAGLVGAVGLEPVLAAVDAGIDIALANKEVMVIAGELVRQRAALSGARIIPVDSEHNAIFQAMQGRERERLRRIVLTASGGPFLGKSAEELEVVGRKEALAHPTWDMGEKISIDSATLMNKGLEVIEARWLFEVEPGEIEVVVHPQSVVHSMVEYIDGTTVAIMAVPDMTIPIAHALAYPDLLDLGHIERLDLGAAGKLTFMAPDHERFPCLGLAYKALEAGGTMPAVANAANEVAVSRFLAGQTGFTAIADTVASAMAAHHPQPYDGLSDILEADSWARQAAAATELQASAGG